MFNSLKARFALIALLVAGSLWLLLDRGITRGLDLQGGTHLALEIEDPAGVMPADRKEQLTDQALYIIRSRIDELGVAEPVIQKAGADRIIVELPGVSDEGRAKEIIQQNAFLQFQIVRPLEDIEGVLPRLDRAVAAAVGAEAGTAATPRVGGLLQSAPGADAAADTVASATPFSSKVLPAGGGAVAQFGVVEADVPAVERYLALPEVQRLLPRGAEFVWGFEPRGAEAPGFRSLYLLNERPLITGEYLEDAQALRDQLTNQPEVSFELSRRGGRIFGRGTGENIGNLMAIVLDERVYSAPVIQSEITNTGRITLGGASIEEARDLALVLRAGALPAPIRVVEERTVGPSLGADSVAKGQIAGMIAIGLVLLIMVGYYRLSGIIAVVALGIYVLFVLGALAGIEATLTLPGIAGFILSIGMAVDANVLIFERIREELALGRSPRVAVHQGFSNALSAIVDSQLTTLITAIILFQFGTGPVRGFAVILAIGIIASMFTAIFVTRTFFMLYLERRTASQPVSI